MTAENNQSDDRGTADLSKREDGAMGAFETSTFEAATLMPMHTGTHLSVTEQDKQESAALKRLWDARTGKARQMNQTQFGKHFNIGTQSAVSQMLLGVTPISVKAAAGFAAGLECQISDFSERLSLLNQAVSISAKRVVMPRLPANRVETNRLLPENYIPVVSEESGFTLEAVLVNDKKDGLTAKRNAYVCKFATDDKRAFGFLIEGQELSWPRFRLGEVAVVHPGEGPKPFDDCLVIWENQRGVRHYKILRVIDVGPKGKYTFDKWDGRAVENTGEHGEMRAVFKVGARLPTHSVVALESLQF